MKLRAVPALLLALTLLPSPLAGQESLEEVESLLARGLVFQARDRLALWWDADRPTAGRVELQRGIWLRGKLTVDPSLAVLDFQRLALEFPGGPYTDDALFRLAQAAEAMGDLPEASKHFRILSRDYPGSPYRDAAAAWLQVNRDAVDRMLARNPTGEATPGEIRASPRDPRAAQADRPAIALQLGAFRNLDGARKLQAELQTSGHQARLVQVPGSPLFRVRLGYFAAREDAWGLQRELDREGWVSTVVFNAHEEQEVG